MMLPLRPKLRPVEIVPLGTQDEFVLAPRDPEGFEQPAVLPYGAAMLAVLMDGRRTLSQIQSDFCDQTGVEAARDDVEAIVRRLDEAWLLDSERFRRQRRARIDDYLGSPVRPASHAGGAYSADPGELRRQLDAFFTGDGSPGPIDAAAASNGRPVCAVLSPHIDPGRGGTAYAWAYKAIAERNDAEVFVIFGTAHNAMSQPFCVSRKDFDTPLGTVRTDRPFIDRLAAHLASTVAGRCTDLFQDELTHRMEHSIEFQVVFLQHVLGGRREFRIVPILAGSFHESLSHAAQPVHSPEFQAFLAAMRAAAGESPGKVCYVSGADFAHIGRRFGDPWLLDEKRLSAQAADDHKLLAMACRGNAAALFRHVARQGDRSRICGLAPLYTMLAVLGKTRGDLLKYGQAVDPEATSCVSFASAAFYRK